MRITFVLATLLILSSLTGSVFAQASAINVNFNTALPMPIGQTDTVAVTVTDTVNSTVQLTFVGLRFEWSPPNNFFIGGNSDKGAVLTAGEQITYSIPTTVPGNITPGIHKLSAYVTYRVQEKGNWTGVLAGWWEADIQFAYPQAQTQSQTQTATQQVGLLEGSNLETVGVLVIVVAIALFLERARIRGFVGKYRKTKPGPTEPQGEKPPVVEKEEEDL